MHEKIQKAVVTHEQHWENGTEYELPEYHFDSARVEGFFDVHHSAHTQPKKATLILL